MEKSNESLIPGEPDLNQSPFQIQTQYVPSKSEIDEQLEIFADIIVSVAIKNLDKKGGFINSGNQK
jgi:hypothetical protein